MNNLYNYYSNQGKPLPSWQNRFMDPTFAAAAGKAGINKDAYIGSADQNNSIMGFLTPSVQKTKKLVEAPAVMNGEIGSKIVNGAINGVNSVDQGIQNNLANYSGTPEQQFSALDNEAESQGKYYQQKLDQIANGTIPLSSTEQSVINSIKNTAAMNHRLEAEGQNSYLKGLEVAGVRSGRSQYAPEVQQGIIKDAINKGTQDLQDLDLKAAQLIEKTRQDILEGKSKAVKESYNAYLDTVKEKRKAILDLQKYNLDYQKFLQTQKYQQQRINLAAKAAYNKPGTLTADEAHQLGLPSSLVGSNEKQLMQSLSFTNPPQWFVDSLPSGQKPQAAMKWSEFQSNTDIQSFIDFVDTQSDPYADFFASADDSAFADE